MLHSLLYLYWHYIEKIVTIIDKSLGTVGRIVCYKNIHVNRKENEDNSQVSSSHRL